jgi:hypothetical protein
VGSSKRDLRQRGADGEESLYRRVDGGDPARSGSPLKYKKKKSGTRPDF